MSSLFRFLALGDSYTIGEGVALEDNWPSQLTRKLRQKDVQIAEPQIIAQTGWTTEDLSSAIERALEKEEIVPPYDLVTLCIGVNDQYQNKTENYAQAFQQLLEQAIQFTGQRKERVLVLSIPDWSVTPFAAEHDRERVQKEIHALNRINARAAYHAQLPYMNLTELSRRARYSREMLVDDGLHYSRAMYRLWVQDMLPKAWRCLMPGQAPFVPLSNDWIEKQD